MAPTLMLTMGAISAAPAAPAPADDGNAALKAQIRQLYSGEPGLLGRTHKMQAFIMELALHAKAQNPDFKVIPQDAAQLAFIDGNVDNGVLPGLVSLVDGWGKESLLLSGDGTTPTNDQRAYIELAKQGLTVTETSTVNSDAQLQEYYRRAANWDIIPYPRIGGTLAQQLYPGKRWATNGDYFWVEDPTKIGLGARIDATRDVDDLSDAQNYLYNINSRPYDAWSTWDEEEAAALAEGEPDRTRITDSYGSGLLVPSPGGPYTPAGNATTVQNAIAQYGDEWDWWWRAAGLDVNAGRETWLNALRNSPYDVIYIDSFYNHRALPDSQTPLTPAEVESLKHKPDGSRRQVIAYLSVGSAEQNRWYAQDDWTWVDPANPNSERSMKSGKIINGVYSPPENAPAWLALGYGGNYAEEAIVQWWNRAWRDIIINGNGPIKNVATGANTSSIDRIVAQGFDGAYLDNVGIYSRTSGGGGWNAFESYWQAHGGIPGEIGPHTVKATPNPGPVTVSRGKSQIAVTVSSAAAGDPTGTVTASIGGTKLDSATLVAGAATLTVGPFATVGDKIVTINYKGDDIDYAVGSTTTTIPVVLGKSSVTAHLTAAKPKVGQKVALTVSATGGAGVPANGQVTAIMKGGKEYTADLVNGVAEISLGKFWRNGTKTVKVRYLGSGSLESSTTTLTFKVKKKGHHAK
jgi:endo-alpha-1,4-polygalactosaminidase (GH114 family)